MLLNRYMDVNLTWCYAMMLTCDVILVHTYLKLQVFTKLYINHPFIKQRVDNMTVAIYLCYLNSFGIGIKYLICKVEKDNCPSSHMLPLLRIKSLRICRNKSHNQSKKEDGGGGGGIIVCWLGRGGQKIIFFRYLIDLRNFINLTGHSVL